jgi:hypothetical protein
MIFKTIIFILIKFVIMYFYDTIKQLLVLNQIPTLFVLCEFSLGSMNIFIYLF